MILSNKIWLSHLRTKWHSLSSPGIIHPIVGVMICGCHFTMIIAFPFLSRTQAVEFFAEWALSPTNVVFQRIQTGMYDPLMIGDKGKWYSQSLQRIEFKVYDEAQSTLGAAVSSCLENRASDDNPTGMYNWYKLSDWLPSLVLVNVMLDLIGQWPVLPLSVIWAKYTYLVSLLLISSISSICISS